MVAEKLVLTVLLGSISIGALILAHGILDFHPVKGSAGIANTEIATKAADIKLPVVEAPVDAPKTLTKPAPQIQNTANSVECIGPDGKHFSATMEECKTFNEKWGKPVDYMTNCNISADCGGGTVRMSYSQCMKPCSGLKNTNPQVVYPNYVPSYQNNAITCTVSYPCTGATFTYQLDPTACQSAQSQAAGICNNSYTYTPPTQPSAPSAPTMTKSQCQSGVNDRYGSKMRNLGCYYPCPDTGACGSTSVCEAYWSLAQKEMAACGQYP